MEVRRQYSWICKSSCMPKYTGTLTRVSTGLCMLDLSERRVGLGFRSLQKDCAPCRLCRPRGNCVSPDPALSSSKLVSLRFVSCRIRSLVNHTLTCCHLEFTLFDILLQRATHEWTLLSYNSKLRLIQHKFSAAARGPPRHANLATVRIHLA
jgi:hypothetical protein